MNDFDDEKEEKRRRINRDALRTELSLQRRQRELAKRASLQAEIDAMKSTDPVIKEHSSGYAGRARGAKCGVQMGGGWRFVGV